MTHFTILYIVFFPQPSGIVSFSKKAWTISLIRSVLCTQLQCPLCFLIGYTLIQTFDDCAWF